MAARPLDQRRSAPESTGCGTSVTGRPRRCWAIFGRGERPAVMTLRVLALVLATVLALPAILVIARTAVAGRDRGGTPGHRRLEALWVVVPIALLVTLVAFAVVAAA